LERPAAVLKQVVKNTNRAPTRIMASSCIAYGFLKLLLNAGLVEIKGKGHYGKRLRLTEKGCKFLKNYERLEELFPER
jgi:predicted transcriptional regulator